MAKSKQKYDTYEPNKGKSASKKYTKKQAIFIGVLCLLVVVSVLILFVQLVLQIDIPDLISGLTGSADAIA